MKFPYAVELIVFDLDGTLINSWDDLSASANYALQQLGLGELSVDLLSSFVGDGVQELMRRALGHILRGQVNHGSLEEAVKIFREHYAQHLVDRTRLYPGVFETLEHFREKRKAVISNKPVEFAAAILNRLGVDNHFDLVLGGDSTTHRKPDPEPLVEVMARLGIFNESAVVVGDSPQDIEMARNAGLLSIAVTNGSGRREELVKAKPDLFIENLYDLTRYLC